MTSLRHYPVIVIGAGNAGLAAEEIAGRVYAYPTFHADLKYLV